MNQINKENIVAQTAFGHLKNTFKNLANKQYKGALSEFWAFIKAVCVNIKSFYTKYLKGQYVEVRGKRIPRTAIAVVALLLLYLISPMSCVFSDDADNYAAEEQTEVNVYEKDGIKVYEMRKCDMSVCGVLEYRGEEDIEKIHVLIGFYDPTGQEIYEGIAEARQIAPNTRSEFSIPAEEEFAYFKLKEVLVNPQEDIEDSNKNDKE